MATNIESNENSYSEADILEYILVDICSIDEEKVIDIKKNCNSVMELLQNINKSVFKVELTIEEKKKIIKFCNTKRRAEIERDEYMLIHGNTDYEKVYEYAREHSNEIENKYNEFHENEKSRILKVYQKVCSESSGLQVNGNLLQTAGSSALYFVNCIVPKLLILAKANPNISKNILSGILNSSDDIASYLSNFNSIKGNLITGGIIFGFLSVYSFGKHLYRYYKKEISGKDLLIFTGTDILIHGACSGTITLCGILGSLVGSIIPGPGTVIGGVIGSLAGTVISAKVIEPLIRKFEKKLAFRSLDKDVNENLYEESLKVYNIQNTTKPEHIKELRRTYLLAYHPDKQPTGEQMELCEKTRKMIELEGHFKIIENYRRANGTWN